MDGPTLTILEGSTFCICDEAGDIGTNETSGFFDEDVRFLSAFRLTVDGSRPLLLSSKKVEHFSASFYLRNPPLDRLPQDTLLISRERSVGTGMEEHVVVTNETQETVSFELGIELEVDFADLFVVKDRDFALGSPDARPLPRPSKPEPTRTGPLVFRDASETSYVTQVTFSREGEVDGTRIRFPVELPARGSWRLRINVHPSELDNGQRLPAPAEIEASFTTGLELARDSLEAWQHRMPRLRAPRPALQLTFDRSLNDLASLRLRHPELLRNLPAAGMPWFMTLFGRDTLITCLQTMMLGPETARDALVALAELQARTDDPEIDAEPGKIIHELRRGKAAASWFPRYYGTVDATPLFLILVSELWRWTGDEAALRELEAPARRALAWIDDYGDRDGDGFVEYERRTPRGLANQSWKDSGTSQRFADGRLAQTPIAPCEVQGYVYDAKRRMAELARELWHDPALAARLDAEAAELQRRFDEAYWLDRRGGYYALALDREKRPVDSLCSNIGHLLWSGIVPDERAAAIVDRLTGEGLWSGWGIRTMSEEDAAYNPLSYHNGSVWPHDNSLVAAGLARYGRHPELCRLAGRLIEGAAYFDHQLPEVFAGVRLSDAAFPIPYPTPGKPQAWAAATPILLLQLVLGLTPDRATRALVTRTTEPLPSWLEGTSLSGMRAFGKSWDARVEDNAVIVEEVER